MVVTRTNGDGSIELPSDFSIGMLGVYDRSLQWVLRHRLATLMSFFVVLAATGALFAVIPKGFVPNQDTDQLAITTEAVQGTSFTQMAEYQREVADIVNREPDVESLVATVGGPAASVLADRISVRWLFT